jgi:Putative Flp pilus-assembly TadE/G-like
MTKTLKTRIARRSRRIAAGLAREDGNVTTLALIMFAMMISVGGLAVDLMRYEEIRTSLQQSLDRCTLAAASLTQEMDPETVCRDYVAKAGHTDDLTDVTVTEGLNFREVTADATALEKPFFAQMVGIDEFNVPAASVAEQRISDIEIAMVLDISGSMQQTPSRITNLKLSAKEFVQSVLENDAEQRTSIMLVPYNGQVNLGTLLRAKYNVTLSNGTAGVDCVDLPSTVYSSIPMSRMTPLPNTANADTFSSTNQTTAFVPLGDTNYATPVAGNRWCPPSTSNVVRLPNNNIATLQSQIEGLSAVGATSINAGMKWGLALLDPSARTMYSEFVGAGKIPTVFSGRPFDYTPANDPNPQSMKVVVLMTDGEHFMEERVKDAYKSGTATNIWKANSDGNYSRFDSALVNSSTATTLCNSRPFWVPHLGVWQSRPWNGTSPSGSACYTNTITTTTTGIAQPTWPQIWTNLRLSYVAWQFYARPQSTSTLRTNTYNTWMANFRDQTATTTMDTQLAAMCSKARDNNVIVFGIAFEAPTNGKDIIRACSTDNAHFYDASGLEIRTAFRAIAAQISQLRLTQ